MFDSFRSRIAQARNSDDLYFYSLLPQEVISASFGDASKLLDSGRIYSTAVTVWVFLSQVMSIHHGCMFAVAKLITFRIARGEAACSPETGGYCIARDKLDEDSMHRLMTFTGQAIEDSTPAIWRWHGHRVITADGTTVSMADTAENQAAYPQQKNQKPGCGFPMMRCVVMFALASGTVLEAAMGKYKGKLTAEISLFREIDLVIEKNDVFLGDRVYSGWFDIARLKQRGADVVVRNHQLRKTDFRTGKRHGTDDHSIELSKPPRPSWMSHEEYNSYPDSITLREIRIRVATPGFRTREIIVVTTFLDWTTYSKEDIAALFRRRWQAELNLRSIKIVMQMDHLRCKKPHRVRNEFRTHLIAYNLIRQVMCEAAVKGNVQPWSISFKGTMMLIMEMLPILQAVTPADELCDAIFNCCLAYRVGDRADRYEPRVRKRRPKHYKLMNKPRNQYKPGLL